MKERKGDEKVGVEEMAGQGGNKQIYFSTSSLHKHIHTHVSTHTRTYVQTYTTERGERRIIFKSSGSQGTVSIENLLPFLQSPKDLPRIVREHTNDRTKLVFITDLLTHLLLMN